MFQEFGGGAQDMQWLSLESFFELYRGHMSMSDFVAMQDMKFADAQAASNLQMNNDGRTYFLPKGAQLLRNELCDIRLKVDGGNKRYQDIRPLC